MQIIKHFELPLSMKYAILRNYLLMVVVLRFPVSESVLGENNLDRCIPNYK